MSDPRVVIVANPNATRLTEAMRDLLVHALASVAKLEVRETTGAGDARAFAEDAARDGVDVVVALGGDGTVNEVANGLLAAGGATALAVVPSGGADVFVRNLGASPDPIEAADAIVRMLEAGATPIVRPVGALNGRAFLFNAGIGLDAAIVAAVEAHPRRKRRWGKRYFVWQAFKVFLGSYRRTPPTVEVELRRANGTTTRVSGALALGCLSDPFTWLGRRGLRLCPGASGAHGVSLLVVEQLTTARALRIAARAFGRARHGRLRGVHLFDDVVEATVRADRPLALQTDGEPLPPSSLARIEFRPSALRVLVAPQRGDHRADDVGEDAGDADLG